MVCMVNPPPPYPKPPVRREWIDATRLEDAGQRLILGAVVVPPHEPDGCCTQCGAPHEFGLAICAYCLTPIPTFFDRVREAAARSLDGKVQASVCIGPRHLSEDAP